MKKTIYITLIFSVIGLIYLGYYGADYESQKQVEPAVTESVAPQSPKMTTEQVEEVARGNVSIEPEVLPHYTEDYSYGIPEWQEQQVGEIEKAPVAEIVKKDQLTYESLPAVAYVARYEAKTMNSANYNALIHKDFGTLPAQEKKDIKDNLINRVKNRKRDGFLYEDTTLLRKYADEKLVECNYNVTSYTYINAKLRMDGTGNGFEILQDLLEQPCQ